MGLCELLCCSACTAGCAGLARTSAWGRVDRLRDSKEGGSFQWSGRVPLLFGKFYLTLKMGLETDNWSQYIWLNRLRIEYTLLHTDLRLKTLGG